MTILKNNFEPKLLVITMFWFAFVAINVNPSLGFTYLGLSSIALFMYLTDKKKSLKIDKDGKWIGAIFAGVLTYVIFILVSPYIISILESVNVGGIIKLLGASTPALATSKVLNFLTFGLFIAFVETQLWARLIDFFGNRIKMGKTALFNFMAWAFILAFSFAFLLFHVTSKGITSNSALLLVFLFMVTSFVLMFIFRETKQSIIFHIVANSIAAYAIFFGGGF
jgi:hypothetical protein